MERVALAQARSVGTESTPGRRLRREWGESLADFMSLKGLSRKDLRHQLAERGYSVSLQAIGYWVRGDTAPQLEHQAAIASVLGVPVRRLFPIESAA